ncbi:MAG: presenilin family intramembrane aspartyl protease [Candidatus Micrarchaeota archaeon]|nr:presenilin family intramembrane aspartyl protease [Candidatus Micrarchaeota archaeon]
MKTVLRLLALFIAAQAIGAAAALPYLEFGSPVTYMGYGIDDLFFIIVGIAFAVLFMLAVVKFYKGELLFRVMELVVVASATFIVFYGLGTYLGLGEAPAALVALAVALSKLLWPGARNITATLSSAGVAIMFAMFLSFLEAIIFLIIMSVYDYVAVFITRHMVTLANEFGRHNMSFSVAAQEKHLRISEAVDSRGRVRQVLQEKTERLELGTGDIALPLAFNLIVLKDMLVYGTGPALAAFLVVGVFSAIALALVLAYVRINRVFLPALPPILLGTITGYMLGYVSGIIY